MKTSCTTPNELLIKVGFSSSPATKRTYGIISTGSTVIAPKSLTSTFVGEQLQAEVSGRQLAPDTTTTSATCFKIAMASKSCQDNIANIII